MPTFIPTEKYAPRVTLHGDDLGLNEGSENDMFLVGARLRGSRVSGLSSLKGRGTVLGQDYKLGNHIRHVEQFDDFLGPVLSSARWNALKGTDGAAATAQHVSQNGGTVRLTSGAGSTHTMAVNGAQLTGDRNFLVSNSGLVHEARAGKISALTSQSIFLGLIDAVTLEAAFTVTGTTVTANATNAVGFVEDAAATGGAAKLNAVAVNAGGSAKSVNLGVDIDTAAYHIYRVEVDAAGNANFFIDGLQVAAIPLAVATTSLLAPTASMFSEATSASQTLDIDYSFTQALRV